MNACPVCLNQEAKFSSQAGQASGLRRRSWYVTCPTCPTSFDISLESLHQLAGGPAQASQLRTRWVRLMAESARRGEKITHLY